MPRLKLKNGGSISISEGRSTYPTTLTIEGAAGTPISVELADLLEIEQTIKLIEDPDAFEEQHG